jgi:hypothetical protein
MGSVQQWALAIGAAGVVVLVLGAAISTQQFLRSYLVGYLFWMGITLGCLAIVMLLHLSGGHWGFVIRRLLESGTRTLPLMILLFLPILLGVKELYVWANVDAIADNEAMKPLLEHKKQYLNVGFFAIRAVFYFIAWAGLVYFLNKWSRQQDESADPKPMRRLEAISGPGLILFGLTATFASVDWVMSLDPEWFSTIFGILFMGGQALSAVAFVIAVAVVLAPREPMSRILSASHLHDLGKLLLAFVMLWAYFAFSQFLIIWSGNLPEEIPWYVHRLHGGWQWLGLALVLFHFMLPFLLLLSRDLKRNARLLAPVACAIIVMRFIDLFWLVAPEFNKTGPGLHWMDLAAPIGVGGLWVALFAYELRKRPLLPLNDPRVEEILKETRANEGHA